MTFDDVLEELMTKSYYLPNRTGDDFAVQMEDAQNIILGLRDTYIPTIEMTREEFTQAWLYPECIKVVE